jgi:gentisate 1,2-dioxygenase
VQAGATANLDLFRFSDTPIFEALHAHRTEVAE